eukprot:10518567-Prorocentrum_lima.AAC.1
MTCPFAPAGPLWLWGRLRSCLPPMGLRATVRCLCFLQKKWRDAVPSPRAIGMDPFCWDCKGMAL